MSGPPLRTLVFDSTNGALWAEEIAGQHGIPVDVAPSPPESRALCDLALLVRLVDAEALQEVLERAGVPFRPWPEPCASPGREDPRGGDPVRDQRA